MKALRSEKEVHFLKRDTCRLCASGELEAVFRLAATPAGDAYIPEIRRSQAQELFPLELVLCRSCGLLQLSGTVSGEILYGNYIYNTAKSLGLDRHFQAYADEAILRLGVKPGSFVIDIGSNDGTLLKCFKRQSMRCLGIDPARAPAARAKNSGIQTITDYFGAQLAVQVRSKYQQAQIITANNVFANIDNLEDMIQGVRMLLADNGVFIFETGYAADLLRNKVLDNIYHEHLSYYCVLPLASFFRKYGMRLFDVRPVSTKGGSIRGFVQLEEGVRPDEPSVAEFIAREKACELDQPQVWRNFACEMEAVKKDLRDLIASLKAKNKSIWAYGASVGVTTLIYYFELGGLIDCIVDDDRERQGLFSPGFHIPVTKPEALYQRKPDYVLILAWRYAESIKDKNQDFLRQGGKFIVPLPKVEVS